MSEATSEHVAEQNDAAPSLSSARDRLQQFFGDSDPIVEFGAAATPVGVFEKGHTDGVVFGLGEVDGMTCVAASCRPEVADGVIGQRGFAELIRATNIAAQNHVPLILLVEGGGYRDGEPPFYVQGRDLTSVLVEAGRSIPILGAALGETRGPLALALGLADIVVATATATISLSEHVAEHRRNAPSSFAKGDDTADARVEDVGEVFARIKHAMQLLHSDVKTSYESHPEQNAELLAKMVCGNARRAIDGRRITDLVLDPVSGFRLRERYGGAVQTTLGRLGGRSVGIVASHSMVNAGAIDADAAMKLGDFLELCEKFAVPVVYLTDVPGLMAGPFAERTAVNRKSVRPYNMQARSSLPHLTVFIRRGFGQGMVLMGGGHHIRGSVLKLAWPTSQFGVMGNKGAASIRSTSSAGSENLVSADDAYSELVERGSADSVAMDFSVDEQIRPSETRNTLIRILQRLPMRTTQRCTSEASK